MMGVAAQVAGHGRSRRLSVVGLASGLLGSGLVVRVARLATRRRLPVLAYHDIQDVDTFARHLDVIQENHNPVTGAAVARAVEDGRPLPRRAIWVTFDDGHPGVIARGLPLLAERGVPATMFICPGVVDTHTPYWWQVVDAALARRMQPAFDGRTWSDRSLVTHLKRVPDDERRDTVRRIADDVEAAGGDPPAVQQVTTGALREWIETGLEVGNHTWDHPCLDTCDDDEQRRQIVTADEWIRDVLGAPARLFAYPNGNIAPASARALAEFGYAVTALFDHKVSRAGHREVSRLRIDADAPVKRFAAVSSGAHPAAFALAGMLRSLGSGRSTGMQR